VTQKREGKCAWKDDKGGNLQHPGQQLRRSIRQSEGLRQIGIHIEGGSTERKKVTFGGGNVHQGTKR